MYKFNECICHVAGQNFKYEISIPKKVLVIHVYV